MSILQKAGMKIFRVKADLCNLCGPMNSIKEGMLAFMRVESLPLTAVPSHGAAVAASRWSVAMMRKRWGKAKTNLGKGWL